MYTCAELQPELVDMWPFANKSDVRKFLMVYVNFCCLSSLYLFTDSQYETNAKNILSKLIIPMLGPTQ